MNPESQRRLELLVKNAIDTYRSKSGPLILIIGKFQVRIKKKERKERHIETVSLLLIMLNKVKYDVWDFNYRLYLTLLCLLYNTKF